jgi:3-hydroxybutyrate dehydrogenase
LGWGRIINISSVHGRYIYICLYTHLYFKIGLVASVNKSAYVSSKHAVIGLTKSLGLELAKTGVTCNAICPGWVMTELI